MKTDVRVAAVALPCPVGDIRGNLAQMQAYAEKAAGQNAHVVVFPELNLTGYAPSAAVPSLELGGPEIRQLSATAKNFNIIIMGGFLEADGGGKQYATHFAAFPNGAVHPYRKTHINSVEDGMVSPGEEIPVFQGPSYCFGMQLCYDAHFPDLSTAMALAGAHILFMPHASPRGTVQDKEESWMRHLPARAFDNGLYVVAVNQAGSNKAGLDFPGLALVLDPLGKQVACLRDGEGMLVADLDAAHLNAIRGHRMRYFLPRRRASLYAEPVVHRTCGTG